MSSGIDGNEILFCVLGEYRLPRLGVFGRPSSAEIFI
jgi:hypothetical protein